MTHAPLLSVSDLSVAIATRDGEIRAVDGVSFTLVAGQTLALVGESGSGKSMTAMSLIGLTPVGARTNISGRAMFLGQDLLTLPEKELRQIRGRRIATIFQDPSAALNPLMSVVAQIVEALPGDVRRSGRAAKHVENLLREVGLDTIPNIAVRHPHELSGGQQQRVAIAAALAGNPSILIADEPTTALDMTVQAQILDLLRRLQEDRGMAILLITHDLGVVANYADDVLVLQKGIAVEQGAVRDVLAAPRQDYTRMLLDARPRIHAASDALPRRQPGGEPLLSVENLTVSYPGRNFFSKATVAVNDVSFAVNKGSALGLVGESGSGKSTVAKTLVGLARMQSGRIRFDGQVLQDPRGMSPDMRARIQYIFQDSYGALNPRLTVEQLVGEPFAIAGMPRRARRDAVVALLEEVGLERLHLARLPRELSGGQRQRINIARALALSPELLICDEIVSALDVSIQAQVLKLLKELQQRRGLTLLFISHDLAVVSELCDRVIVMQSGCVVEEGDARDVLNAPREEYTQSLLAAAMALEQVEVRSGVEGRGVRRMSFEGAGIAP